MLMDLVDSGIFRIRTVILELEHLNHLERIITDSWALLPEFLIQGQGPRTCIFKFSGDADDTSPGTTFGEALQ